MTSDLSRRAGVALRALVEAGRLRSAWLPGMSDEEGRRVLSVDSRMRVPVAWAKASQLGIVSEPGAVAWCADRWSFANPDTDDPLTVMGLRLLAREAWLPGDPIGYGATEAEAIVAALETAADVTRG